MPKVADRFLVLVFVCFVFFVSDFVSVSDFVFQHLNNLGVY